MANYFNAKIEIGGEVTLQDIKDIHECILDNVGSFEWGGAAPSFDEIREAAEDEDLTICDSQARNGEMTDLMSLLRERNIAYRHVADGKYEFDAMITFFDGETMPDDIYTNNSEHELVLMSDAKAALDLLVQGKYDEAEKKLRSLVINTTLPPLKIVAEKNAGEAL